MLGNMGGRHSAKPSDSSSIFTSSSDEEEICNNSGVGSGASLEEFFSRIDIGHELMGASKVNGSLIDLDAQTPTIIEECTTHFTDERRWLNAFDEPETEESIIFEEGDPKKSILALTIERLVVRLTTSAGICPLLNFEVPYFL